MNIITKEYDLGKILLNNIDKPLVNIKLDEPDSIILGEIIGGSNELLNLEIVLCTVDIDNKLIPLNVIKPNLGVFKFYGVPIGRYFILNKKSKEINLENSTINNGTIVSEQTVYNFLNAKFENGAMLYSDWAIRLGGYSDGSATVQIYVNQKGLYEINLKYLGANKFFKLDVNSISSDAIYHTPNQNQGNILIKVNLNEGNNELKFHGDLVNYGPDLYDFSLTLLKSSSTYNLIDGILKGSARIDKNKNMVVGLGGLSKGEVTINVTAEKFGYYSLYIDYNLGLRSFLIDVNGINTGEIYSVQSEFNGKYRLEISLNQGENSLRFYGVGTNIAPNLGEFVLNFINSLLPWPKGYNVAKGILKNGAKLNNTRNLVLNLGGPQNASSTVVVNVEKAGKYNLEVEFRSGSKYLKLDINKITLNENFITPAGDYGVFTAVITLTIGANEIKFYGITNEYASNLGNFKLSYIEPDETPIPVETYESANGIFGNGAQLDISNNFVTSLGGPNDGSVTVNVTASEKRRYDLDIKYLTTDPNKILRVTVNNKYSGMYTVSVTNTLSLADAKILDFRVNLNEGVNKIKFHGDLVNYAPMIGSFKLTLTPPKPTQSTYTFEDLNKLSYVELVNVLKQIKFSDIEGMFEYSNDSYTFYNDDERVNAIIGGLGKSGQSFTERNERGIDTLVEVLRSGFYIAYNNQQLNKLNDIVYRNKCIPAIKLVMNNINFKLGTTTQNKVVFSIAKLIGNASADVEIINKFSNILSNFSNNLAEYSNDSFKNNAIHKILNEVNHFLTAEKLRSRGEANTIFYDKINPFLTEVESLAQKGLNFDREGKWLVNDFIYFSGMLSIFRRDSNITHLIISNCLRIYPDLSSEYIEALKRIQYNFNGVLADGTSINYDNEKERAKLKFLPNEYKFDDSTIVVKIGDKVEVEKVKRLYWASKEVRAQFMRVANNEHPLDIGNADEILTIVIYNSPEEYKFNSFIYGYSVENGGIYIEKVGTFFTYERTPQDSIFSLEELFRHEYVHYLDARYLVKGLFGGGDLHQGDRLVWFAEGAGEFFAGSTRKSDVQPRISIVQNLLNNKNKLSVSQILRSKYGSFNFYYYAFTFVNYMYTRNLNQLLEIVRLLKANDVDGYDNYISYLSNDDTTSTLYEQTLSDLIDNIGNYSVPAVSDDYLINHPNGDIITIKDEILMEIALYNISIETKNSEYFQTFSLRGSCNNGVSIDRISDWQSMNRKLNSVLENLEQYQWSGYKTVSAYFTNYTVNNEGYCFYDVVFFGILNVL